MSRQHPVLPKNRGPCALPPPVSSASFWHSQPTPLLMGHRSTRHLPETADIVVIGSGMTGASVAHHLLTPRSSSPGIESDLDVVMLEAREACWGATGRNGGHCQPLLFETPHDPSIGHFELANFRALQTLISEQHIDCEFVAQPGIRAIYSQHHLDDAELSLAIMKTTAPDLSAMMALVTDKKELERYRIPTAIGAVVTSVAARMWPYKFVSHILSSLITATELRGSFNLQTLTPVEAIVSDGNTGRWSVKTSRGNILAKKVILCTNAYTSHLLPEFADLIVSCRGQMSALRPLPGLQGEARLKTSVGFLGDGLDDYLIQRPNETGGHLMFGGGRQHSPSIGVTDDSGFDEETARYLRTRLVEAMRLDQGGNKPSTAEFTATHQWTGIMGFSRDERPWVGPVPQKPNLYLAAGFTGHGMPNTWLCGKAVALMACHSLSSSESEGRLSDGEDAAIDRACAEVGLPGAYRCSGERMLRALACDAVEVTDWAEMHRGKTGDGRPASGYA